MDDTINKHLENVRNENRGLAFEVQLLREQISIFKEIIIEALRRNG